MIVTIYVVHSINTKTLYNSLLVKSVNTILTNQDRNTLHFTFPLCVRFLKIFITITLIAYIFFTADTK